MPFTENCERLVSVYATKNDGDLLTIPFQVRCSKQGYRVHMKYQNIDTPESSFAVFLCKDHSVEESER